MSARPFESAAATMRPVDSVRFPVPVHGTGGIHRWLTD